MEDLAIVWLSISTFGIFIMQVGFALLEAGSVRIKSVNGIILKNVLDTSFTAVVWYLFGYGVGYGNDYNGFIGTTKFALTNSDSSDALKMVYYFMFATTSGTILSGAIAERGLLVGYLAANILLVGFVNPVVSHWVWSDHGWLNRRGFIDFSGSGVIHLLGGIFAFVGAYVIGPRKFLTDNAHPRGHSVPLIFLGTGLLYFGWLFFNASPVIFELNGLQMSGRVILNTILSPSASVCGYITIINQIAKNKTIYIEDVCNYMLIGLVAITGGCYCLEPWAAIVTGTLASFAYYGSTKLLAKIKVDDPVNATSVHMVGGLLGVLLPGILAAPQINKHKVGAFHTRQEQLGTQCIAALAITGWSLAFSVPFFYCLRFFDKLRISPEEESVGIDIVKYGGEAYSMNKDKKVRHSHVNYHSDPSSR